MVGFGAGAGAAAAAAAAASSLSSAGRSYDMGGASGASYSSRNTPVGEGGDWSRGGAQEGSGIGKCYDITHYSIFLNYTGRQYPLEAGGVDEKGRGCERNAI